MAAADAGRRDAHRVRVTMVMILSGRVEVASAVVATSTVESRRERAFDRIIDTRRAERNVCALGVHTLRRAARVCLAWVVEIHTQKIKCWRASSYV